MARGEAVARATGTLARPRRPLENQTFMEARVIFPNFKGREGQYNNEGDRNFGLILPEDRAEEMYELGWNVKRLKETAPGEGQQAWIPVAVGYGKGRPPKIIMVTSKGKSELNEDLVEALDDVEWASCDVIIRPYSWGPIQGNFGVKAYLSSLAVVVREDEIDKKYADVPMIGEPRSVLGIAGGDPVKVIQGQVEIDEDDVEF
jgi:hypothetical protein